MPPAVRGGGILHAAGSGPSESLSGHPMRLLPGRSCRALRFDSAAWDTHSPPTHACIPIPGLLLLTSNIALTPLSVTALMLDFQKFRERFEFSRENSKLLAKIQIFSGTFPVSPEIRNFSRKIKFPAEVFKSPLKIRIASRKTETSAED